MWREYLFPMSVGEALQMLAEHRGRARIIAGGTDLVLQCQAGKVDADVVVDITRIPGLDAIEERDDYIHIGAQVTHGRVAASPLIRERARILALACATVGGPQIRNTGTLVGNVVNALPAADGAVALFALDAEVEAADLNGRRWLPIRELYRNVGVCLVDPRAEMITGLRFRPLQAHHRCSFQRVAPRRALSLPILNVAAVLSVVDGRFQDVRIAMGPVASLPFRAAGAEAALLGQVVTDDVIAQAAALAMQAAQPRDSVLRGSRVYRKALVQSLVRRALSEAVGLTANGKGGA